MAIKRAKYWNDHNVFHFETDDRQVLILDKDNNVLGTLREMLFTGKVVSGGNFKDIKHTGVYRVKGLQGMPSNIPTDKECILAVTAIGDVNNPDMILYRLISPNGVITENTVSGSQASGWMSGGVGLQNTIKGINSSLGEVAHLATKAKDLTGAVNELNGLAHGTAEGLQKLTQQFNQHNHDDRYVNQDGDAMSGDLAMANGSHYHVFNKGGTRANFGYMTSGNELVIGDSRYPIRFNGQGELTYNGHKIFMDSNVGAGSNLDADKLDGLDSNEFIRVHRDDVKNSALTIDQHNVILRLPSENNNGNYWSKSLLQWRNSNNQPVADVESNGVGDVVVRPGGDVSKRAALRINQNNTMVYYGNRVNFVGTDGNGPDIRWYTEDQEKKDGGLGFFIPEWNRNELAFGNWNTHEVIMEFAVNNGEAIKIAHSPYIGDHGCRLFLQNEQPGGDVPYGSVWIGL